MILGFATVLALLWISGNAEACPVCFSAKEGTRAAFIGTTIFLSLLPLWMIGGIALWLKLFGSSNSDNNADQ